MLVLLLGHIEKVKTAFYIWCFLLFKAQFFSLHTIIFNYGILLINKRLFLLGDPFFDFQNSFLHVFEIFGEFRNLIFVFVFDFENFLGAIVDLKLLCSFLCIDLFIKLFYADNHFVFKVLNS